MAPLADELQAWLGQSRRRIENLALAPRLEQVGRVARVGDGVATVIGSPDTRLDELLVFDGGVRGVAVDLGEATIGCSAAAPELPPAASSTAPARWPECRSAMPCLGASSIRSGRRSMAALLLPQRPLAAVEQPAPAIVDRALVTRPLATGLLVVDAMIPLGRGQRELIIGDRGTGKTAIAVDTIINQRSTGVISVYAAVGQKASSVAQVIAAVRRYGAPDHCIFVIGEADAPPGLQWLTPYSAYRVVASNSASCSPKASGANWG